MSNIFDYTPCAGITLEEAFKDAKNRVDFSNLVCNLHFNGIVIPVNGFTTYEDFANKYLEQANNRERKLIEETYNIWHDAKKELPEYGTLILFALRFKNEESKFRYGMKRYTKALEALHIDYWMSITEPEITDEYGNDKYLTL